MEKYINEKLLNEFMVKNNLSMTAFCKKCKIASSTYKRILEGCGNIGINTFGRIARVMGVHIKELFRRNSSKNV